MNANTTTAGPHRPQVAVDTEVCEAAGVCTRMVRQVFALGEDDVLRITRQPDTPELERRVEMAVRRCPKQALRLT
ncbi:ferredoxin [Streptomyces hirsutus]|uniref:ferredoxin n=1 Tax=Streptomyces hirsutus TaxID=35620 RepID=UPI003651B770